MTAITRREESTSRDRGALAKMIMTLLDHWQLSTEDQAALLGIAASNRTHWHAIVKAKPLAPAGISTSGSATC